MLVVDYQPCLSEYYHNSLLFTVCYHIHRLLVITVMCSGIYGQTAYVLTKL